MRKIVICMFLAAFCLQSFAQNAVDSLYIDTRVAFHLESVPGETVTKFQGDHLNLNIWGHIAPNVDYRLRQRLNKQVFDARNIFNATDFLYVNWHATDKLRLMVGKQAVLIGGYEYDAVPIDVYFYSQFCNNLYQGFTMGASLYYRFMDGQDVIFQFCDSPLSLGFENVYAYNLAWSGSFAPWWHTIWSTNFVQDRDSRFVNYVSLGNHFTFGNILFDLDVMNRAGIGQRSSLILSDYTVISKFIWSVGKWNICWKAGYERNEPWNVDASGRPYDEVILPGTEYLYGGAGLEYFPMGDNNLRLHAVYYRDNSRSRNNFEFGVTWRLDIIKR